MGGMLSQNVLNLVDSAMVGVLGDASLAAVGMGGMVNFVVSSFIMGMSSGVQAMASRRLGEGKKSETAVPLNGGLLLVLAIAVPWSCVVWLLVPSFFPWLVDDPEVVGIGVPYLQTRVVAMTALGMNFAFRGYWNAVNRSSLYMRTLVFMHVINIALNGLLIYGLWGLPKMGAVGAGWASAISTWLGTGYYFYLGFRRARPAGFLRGLPHGQVFSGMMRLAIPTGMQQLFFALGMTVFHWIVGQLGTRELAATSVLVTLLLVGVLPGMGFGLAGMSLVGQALGRKDVADARLWGWQVAALASAVVSVLMIPGLIAPHWILGVFLHDPVTLGLAEGPLRLLALTLGLDAVGMVLMNALFGAGDNRRVMWISIGLQWGLFLPCIYLVGPVLGWGFSWIWTFQVGYRLIQTALFSWLWRGGGWTAIRV